MNRAASTRDEPLAPFRSIIEPRLLTRQQAAERCGLTESGFSSWVIRKLVPGSLPGTRRWDAKALDQALDRLSGLNPERELTPYEKWKQANAAREA